MLVNLDHALLSRSNGGAPAPTAFVLLQLRIKRQVAAPECCIKMWFTIRAPDQLDQRLLVARDRRTYHLKCVGAKRAAICFSSAPSGVEERFIWAVAMSVTNIMRIAKRTIRA